MNGREFVEKEIRKIIDNNIKLTKTIEEIAPDEELQHYGMNSLTIINAIAEIEELFDFEYRYEDLEMKKINTINKLTDYVMNMTK